MLVMVQQRGFWHNRSSPSHMTNLLDEVIGKIERGERVDICYLKFQKALNSVKHRILDQNARAFGENAKINKMLKV